MLLQTRPMGMRIWLPVSLAPSCIVTTNPFRTCLNPFSLSLRTMKYCGHSEMYTFTVPEIACRQRQWRSHCCNWMWQQAQPPGTCNMGDGSSLRCHLTNIGIPMIKLTSYEAQSLYWKRAMELFEIFSHLLILSWVISHYMAMSNFFPFKNA